jgi:hypothetical protein
MYKKVFRNHKKIPKNTTKSSYLAKLPLMHFCGLFCIIWGRGGGDFVFLEGIFVFRAILI